MVGNSNNSESLSINMPSGLLPTPSAKRKTFSTFSVTFDSTNKVSLFYFIPLIIIIAINVTIVVGVVVAIIRIGPS